MALVIVAEVVCHCAAILVSALICSKSKLFLLSAAVVKVVCWHHSLGMERR